ncbi:hypothetical protein CEP54_007243 [Fusarium duplospermum]|uniref:Uncharacterized protein n=1 Tax=Fusarium duplospermum TaxID=1325734 RepID=A0A428Q2L6_9HYPO|nr:hypothetical protein CEP54_007243 [Fusarium duplospermum]
MDSIRWSDLRALVNLARGTVTINEVRGELRRLASLHERADRVNKLIRADVVATKTWVDDKIYRAIAGSPPMARPTPIRPTGRLGTADSMEKQAGSRTSMARKHYVPATSLSAAKRQKTVDRIAKLNKLRPGSSFQTTPEDKQIMDSFINWLGKKDAGALEDASGARGQQVIEQALKQSGEAHLKAIEEDQTRKAAALSQLLSLQQSHSGAIGDDLVTVIRKLEARVKASQEDLDNAEKDTVAHIQFLEKLSESIETAKSNAARLKQGSENLSKDVEAIKKKANISSTANMFFKFGLDHTIEALEADFGDVKDWIEQKITAEGQHVDGLASNSSQHV